MRNHYKLLLTLLMCICFVQVNAAEENRNAALAVGDMAPEFSLQGSDGQVHQLSDYRGTSVVVAWFPKAFTSG